MATSDGPLRRLREGLKPGGPVMLRVLQRVGQRAVATARQAFEDQGRGGKQWPPRAYPNVAGILADARDGATVKERRFETRPAGVDTNTLRQSIAAEVRDGKVVVVGSNLPYASDVQRGGERRVTLDAAQRDNLARMIKKDRRLQFSKRLRALANGTLPGYVVKTPPRPFLAVTAQDRKDYELIFQDEVRRALRS